MPLPKEGTYCHVNKFTKKDPPMFGGLIYIPYLCIDNVREMSGWGRDTSWSVDSDLLLYIIKGSPQYLIWWCEIILLSL